MTSTRRGKPRYAEIGEQLQAEIERGEHPVGSLLPTELELCERFGASRHTVRTALAQLSRAGLVLRRPGAGTRVLARSAAMRYEHEVDTVNTLMQYGNTTRLQVLEAGRRTADAGIATLLEIPEGKEYLHLRGLRLEEPGRHPIALTDMLVPLRRGVPTRGLLDPASGARTVARFLDPARLSRVEQVFDAVAFDAAEASLLGVKAGDPAMRVQRRYRDQGERLLMVAISLHPPDRFAYSMVLSRNHA